MYTVGLDGASPLEVLQASLEEFGSVGVWNWFPDSQHVSMLAFDRNNAYGVFTVPLKGGEAARLKLPDEGCWSNLEWRAAGTQLFVERCESGPEPVSTFIRANIWRLTVDPHAMTVLATERLTAGDTWATGIAPSPDGTHLALAKLTTTQRVWSVPFNGDTGRIEGEGEPVTDATANAMGVGLSADGTRIAYTLSRTGGTRLELWTTDLVTGQNQRLVADDQSRNFPHWSRDGRWLAYLWQRPVGTAQEAAVAAWHVETAREQFVTAPSVRDGLVFASDWSPDGRFVLVSSSVPKPPNMSLSLWPFDAAPHDKNSVKVLAWDPDFDLGDGEASFSPDGHWVCFEAVNLKEAGASIIEVIPSEGTRTRSQWTALTSAHEWADKPRWSPDGKLVYFIQSRNSFWNVWAVRFDGATGNPVGEPFQVTHYDSVRHRIPTELEGSEIGVSAHRLILTIAEQTGNIWMLDNVNR